MVEACKAEWHETTKSSRTGWTLGRGRRGWLSLASIPHFLHCLAQSSPPSSLGIRQLGLLASPPTSPSPTPSAVYVHPLHLLAHLASIPAPHPWSFHLSTAHTIGLRQSQSRSAAAHAHSTALPSRRLHAFYQAAFRPLSTTDLAARSLSELSDTPHPLDIFIAPSQPSSAHRRPPCAQRSWSYRASDI